jgi:hypothetical protein
MTIYRVLADIAEPGLVASGAIPSGSFMYYNNLIDIPSCVSPQHITIFEPIKPSPLTVVNTVKIVEQPALPETPIFISLPLPGDE